MQDLSEPGLRGQSCGPSTTRCTEPTLPTGPSPGMAPGECLEWQVLRNPQTGCKRNSDPASRHTCVCMGKYVSVCAHFLKEQAGGLPVTSEPLNWES